LYEDLEGMGGTGEPVYPLWRTVLDWRPGLQFATFVSAVKSLLDDGRCELWRDTDRPPTRLWAIPPDIETAWAGHTDEMWDPEGLVLTRTIAIPDPPWSYLPEE
jgi:hypothetical protein